MAIIISAFPGCGKSTICNEAESYGLNRCHVYYDEREGVKIDVPASDLPPVFDSDSSIFPKPEFPGNYIEHIKGLIERFPNAVIMVSSHDVVRQALHDNGIQFSLVYPETDAHEEYIYRYINRGSPEWFVQLMRNRWGQFITSCENDQLDHAHHYRLPCGQYLKDVYPLIK